MRRETKTNSGKLQHPANKARGATNSRSDKTTKTEEACALTAIRIWVVNIVLLHRAVKRLSAIQVSYHQGNGKKVVSICVVSSLFCPGKK